MPILITDAAIGVAMTATVFGALAVFTAFYDGTYRRALEDIRAERMSRHVLKERSEANTQNFASCSTSSIPPRRDLAADSELSYQTFHRLDAVLKVRSVNLDPLTHDG